MGKILKNKSYVELEDKAFSFSEFFKTDGDKFIHEKDVTSFLNLLVKEGSNYPFATEEYRKIFRHSLWIIPGVKAGKALTELLRNHKIFSNFEIVNVAGKDDEESTDALQNVKDAINAAGEEGYTITISCGKLTAGVTVPEWTAVFMLAGGYSTSAANYLQTIFRVQSPCDRYGVSKRQCYVFDFAPDRTLKMIAASAAISARAGKTTSTDRDNLAELLNYLPIIALDGSTMNKYTADKLLRQLKRAYAEKVLSNGFDDTRLYNDKLLKLDDLALEDFKRLRKITGAAKSSKSSVVINSLGLEGKTISARTKRQLTDEEKEILRAKSLRANAISILRQISIRMPLLIYLKVSGRLERGDRVRGFWTALWE